MKKFIYKIIGFILIPVAILLILELIIFYLKPYFFSETILDNIYCNKSGNYEWINEIKSDSLIILSASSSVRYGLSCKILNDLSEQKYAFVNLAMDARDPIETYFILKHLNLKKIKKIYFSLDPWIYTKRYYMHRNNYFYLDFSFIEILKYSYEHDKSSFMKRYKSFALYILPNKCKNNSALNLIIPENFGSLAIERSANKKSANNFNAPINNFFQIEKYSWSKLQFQYLSKIADLCKREKIELTLFITPKRSDYSKFYKSKCIKIHNEFVSNIEKEKISLRVFGKYDQLESIGDTIYFSDIYHLNKLGQERYSHIFYEMINREMYDFTKNYEWFLKK